MNFRDLSREEQMLFCGHSLVVVGSAILAFANLVRMLKAGELPTHTDVPPQTHSSETNYYKRKNYFQD